MISDKDAAILSSMAVFAVLVILALIDKADAPYRAQFVEQYCELVDIYRQSEGQYGWPDYRGDYERRCKGYKDTKATNN